MINASEELDVVDRDGNVVGRALRSECHNNPKLIHRVVHSWIFNKKGQVLWQQRSLLKKEAPGLWDMSCGGHVPAGEEPDVTIIRELDEELGVKNAKPIFVERYLRGSSDGKQTELIYLYYLVVDKPESSFDLEKEEVEQVKWYDIDEAQTLYCSQKIEATSFIIGQLPRILQKVFAQSIKR